MSLMTDFDGEVRNDLQGPINYQSGLPIRKSRGDERRREAVVDRVRFGIATDSHGIVIGRWKSEYFDCVDPLPNGYMSWICPCVSMAQITARMGFRHYCLTLIVLSILSISTYTCLGLSYLERPDLEPNFEKSLLYSINLQGNYLFLALLPISIFVLIVKHYRGRVRKALSIPGSATEDMLLSFCCQSCVIAQMASQVKSYERHSCWIGPLDTLPGYTASSNITVTEPTAVEEQADFASV